MIKGDRLIINRKGISISDKRMEDVRIYEGSQVYMLPFRTFEFRPKESGTQFPVDIFLTPIPPEKWPFVMRFNIRLRNRPGTFKKVYEFFERLQINVLSSETIRSGHHHDTLNVLGEITRLEVKTLKSIFNELKAWKSDREKIYKNMYSIVYQVEDLTHYFTKKQFEAFSKKINENLKKKDVRKLLNLIQTNYSRDSDKYYFNLDELNDIYTNYFDGKELQRGCYEEVTLAFIKKDMKEEGEFYTPMWYDILKKYAEKSEEISKEDFTKIQKNIDTGKGNIQKWVTDLLKIKVEKSAIYDEEMLNKLERYAEGGIDKLVENFPNFVTELIPKINRELNIDCTSEDLLPIIETLGKKIEESRDVGEKKSSMLGFYKKITVLSRIILEWINEIKFWELELKEKKKKIILSHLESELNRLCEMKTESDKKKFNEKLGIYLAYQYLDKDKGDKDNDDITISELLESEIKRAKPKVFKLKTNDSIEPETKYLSIQKEMLLIKAILSALVTYKKMLGYRFKLLLVEDSLEYDKCKYTSSDFTDSPTENYIYNIRYYEHILRYPYFAKRAILHSSLNSDFWKIKMLNIIDRLKRLPGELNLEWGIDPANNLDPINITPVELLSHAFYHRVYEKELTVWAEKSHIPFHPRFPTELLNNILPEENSSTYGIASFNIESLSCRICPIPVSKLRRFAEIELTKSRNCHDDCLKHGKKRLKKFVKEKEHSIFIKKDNPYKTKKQSCVSEDNLHDDIYCNGSSMGLMSTWLNALSSPIDPIEKYGFNFNIWRTFNRTTQMDHENESGDIKVWAQAIKEDFLTFPPDINGRIQGKFNAHLQEKFPHGHLSGENIELKEFFSSKIFISLPFIHPMRDEWLEYIKKVGSESGFSEVKTTETYTKPVTEEVGNDIKDCSAMIQILSFPDRDAERNSARGLDWLNAEYLTALNLGKKVIRLVDTSTIQGDVVLGKDHMTFEFSRMKPFSNFAAQVRKAFSIFRQELFDIYKI